MDVGVVHPVRWFRPGDDFSGPGVPGTYQVDEEGHIEAHVHEIFDGERPRLLLPDPSFPTTLHGRVMREGVTLVGARVAAQTTSTTEQRDVVLSADYALEGLSWVSGEDLAFTKVRLRFTDQETWTGWSRFSVMANEWPPLTDMGAVLKHVPEDVAQVDGGTLRLVDGSYTNWEHETHRFVLQSLSWFEYEFAEPVPISHVLERYAYPLQVMLMSASGRLPGVVSMGGSNAAWDFGDDQHKPRSSWLTLRRYHGPLSTPHVSDLQYLHRLRDLEFRVHMPLLLEAVDTHRYALGHYGLLKSERFIGGHPVRFSVATQLIDAFDRTLHLDDQRDISFETRLKRLEDESGNLVDDILGNRSWRGDIGKLRNIVVHGDRYAHEVLRDQRSLVAGHEALLLLFEVRFLVAIGLSPERARSQVVGRARHWTIEKAVTENYPALRDLIARHEIRRRQSREQTIDPTT